jgi:chromosome segregation ATPase
MAEEDREEANHQIDQLQSHIQLQSRQLNEAQNMLKDKHVHVQEMEQRFKELEAQGTNFTEQNRELTAEVSQLREELSDSNKRAAQLGEKYRAYKHKINEAINEQQDLYKKTKSHYEDMMTELRNVESKRASTSQEIEGVLQASKQKRDDMKKLLHELQDQSASELQQSMCLLYATLHIILIRFQKMRLSTS